VLKRTFPEALKQAPIDLLRLMVKKGDEELWFVTERVYRLGSRRCHLFVPQAEGKSRTCVVIKSGLNVLFSCRYSNRDLTVALCERRIGPNPCIPGICILTLWGKTLLCMQENFFFLVFSCHTARCGVIWPPT